MTDRSSVIFGNKMPDKVYKKAVKSKKKYIKKFGDDSRKNYEVSVEKNRYIGDSLGVYNILVGNPAENAHAGKGTFDTEKGSLSEISVWDLDTTAFPWRWRLRRRRWAIRLTGWT